MLCLCSKLLLSKTANRSFDLFDLHCQLIAWLVKCVYSMLNPKNR